MAPEAGALPGAGPEPQPPPPATPRRPRLPAGPAPTARPRPHRPAPPSQLRDFLPPDSGGTGSPPGPGRQALRCEPGPSGAGGRAPGAPTAPSGRLPSREPRWSLTQRPPRNNGHRVGRERPAPSFPVLLGDGPGSAGEQAAICQGRSGPGACPRSGIPIPGRPAGAGAAGATASPSPHAAPQAWLSVRAARPSAAAQSPFVCFPCGSPGSLSATCGPGFLSQLPPQQLREGGSSHSRDP